MAKSEAISLKLTIRGAEGVPRYLKVVSVPLNTSETTVYARALSLAQKDPDFVKALRGSTSVVVRRYPS